MAERTKIVLVCEACGARNYRTTKSQANQSTRLTLKKHCPSCNKHTQHKESK